MGEAKRRVERQAGASMALLGSGRPVQVLVLATRKLQSAMSLERWDDMSHPIQQAVLALLVVKI